jgi:hypothetical protein
MPRTTTVLMATSPRLLAQRTDLGTLSRRRAATVSPSASSAKTAANDVSRINISSEGLTASE